MRAINWEQLLKEHRIPYIESGANVKRGELAIQCPFCGSADPSKHMGLNLETGWWSCWRNRAQHSGKSPLRLLMKLIGVPYGRAREIAGLGDDYIDPEGFDAVAARVMGRDKTEGRKEQTQRHFLHLDPDFTEITERARTRRHWNYLFMDRKFNLAVDDPEELARTYGLMAGVTGTYAQRIILPYYLDGKLVTWSARAISPATLRYIDLPLSESLLGPKETLFNHDCIPGGGKALIVAEGPFDALKLDFYGQRYGVRAVGISTNSITEAQTYLLQNASDKFERVIVMLDNATTLGLVDSMRMKQSLYFLKNVSIEPVPFGVKDGGDLTPAQVKHWARAL